MIYNYIKKLASGVFSRYNGEKDSFELFTLRTFIDNINNERVKNKKDVQEEFKTVKKNVESEALKKIVKELERAIFGYDDDKDKEELERAEELDRRFKKWYIPSRQILVPRTSRGRPPSTSPGRPLKVLVDHLADVPV